MFVCQDCGNVTDRDYNAACNIQAVGLTASVCGGHVRRGRRKSEHAVSDEAENTLLAMRGKPLRSTHGEDVKLYNRQNGRKMEIL